MVSVDANDSERDLTAREINALVAIVMMLTKSSSLVGDVDHNYVKKQLYHDKQESIPKKALIICSKLINTLRYISLKENEVASFVNCFQMRSLRNTVVTFAETKTKFRERRLYPVIDEQATSSLFVTAPTLYLIFHKEYRVFSKSGEVFTNYQTITSEEDKSGVLGNFFNLDIIERIMKDQNLSPMYSFYYNNQSDIQFLGEKIYTKHHSASATNPPPPSDIKPLTATSITGFDKNSLKDKVKVLTEEIKLRKNEYAALGKRIKNLELERMDLGKTFRSLEKKEHLWNSEKYNELKRKRKECDALYTRLKKLNGVIKASQTEMYYLNKQLSGQSVPVSTNPVPLLPQKTRKSILEDKALIQGLDPGIVTTGSFSCVKPSTLFESVNRFEKLQVEETVGHDVSNEKEFNLDFTASMVNKAALSTSHRMNRERRRKNETTVKTKELDRKRVTRKIRTKRFYKRYFSNHRNELIKYHKLDHQKGSSMITFVGDWGGSGQYIRGHSRRSLKPVVARLRSVNNDMVSTVDEYRSTITCSSCFEITTKQIIRTGEGKKKRIKGAVTCLNPMCPRRISAGRTTVNRDYNGAKNIALIGFSRLISEDQLPLPPFRKGIKNNSNK